MALIKPEEHDQAKKVGACEAPFYDPKGQTHSRHDIKCMLPKGHEQPCCVYEKMQSYGMILQAMWLREGFRFQ